MSKAKQVRSSGRNILLSKDCRNNRDTSESTIFQLRDIVSRDTANRNNRDTDSMSNCANGVKGDRGSIKFRSGRESGADAQIISAIFLSIKGLPNGVRGNANNFIRPQDHSGT